RALREPDGAQCVFLLLVGVDADDFVAAKREDVRDVRIDLDAAALARAAYPDERDHLLAGRDHAPRFIAEAPENVACIAPELANPVMAPVGAAARAGDDPRVPDYLRIEQPLRLV